jgi:hypothetical protein
MGTSRLHNSDAHVLVGAYERVGAYASFKKLASGSDGPLRDLVLSAGVSRLPT